MADVKWIKITTDIFDDEKILLIESLPDAYAIIVVWFKLLCLAGKQNNSGVFLMNDRIAYTDKMLATIFRMKETTVTMALQTFEQFGMIERVDNVITIPNWGKHQNLDQLESKKQYMRNYMQEYRKKQKLLSGKPNCKTNGEPNNKPNSKSNVSEADKEIDIERDIDIEKEYIYTGSDEPHPFSEHMNPPVDKSDEEPEPKKPQKEKPVKHKYGEYKNVLLTDEELDKLKTKFPDWEERIENLSLYIESKGARYKSHYATILSWARRDTKQVNKTAGNGTYGAQSGNAAGRAALELDEFYKMMAEWSHEGEE